MTTIEVPIWVIIITLVFLFIVLLHIMVGDTLGKMLYIYIKNKEEKEKKEDENTKRNN